MSLFDSNGIITLQNIPAMLSTFGNLVKPIRRLDMFILTQKKCSKCKEVKAMDDFYSASHTKDGKRSDCIKCVNARHREQYTTHKEKIAERGKRYYAEHRDGVLIRSAERYQNNHDAIIEQRKQHNLANPEKMREHSKKYYNANKDTITNRIREWRKNNLDKVRLYWHTWYNRVNENGGKITEKDWKSLKEKYLFTCLCCGRKEPDIKLTLDHVIPVSLGGENVIENAQPLCQSCNSSKNAKHIDYRKW